MSIAGSAAKGGTRVLIGFVAVVAAIILVLWIFDFTIPIVGGMLVSILGSIGDTIVVVIVSVFSEIGQILGTIILLPLEVMINTIISIIDLIPGVDIDCFDLTGDSVESGCA